MTVCAILVGVAVTGLVVVHQQLDSVIDVDSAEITDREAFTIGHRRYNQLTTIEWMASLAYLPITIAAWRSMDRRSETTEQDNSSSC